jgi:quercetin dioxygenase-like cupin family protein
MMFYKKNETGYRVVMDGIRLKTLVHGERTLLCEFKIEKGKVLPSHKHHHEQTGYLVSGRMKFTIGDEEFYAEPGDSWCIPGDMEHAAEAFEDSSGVEVFSPVREDYLA